jgi:hypothetical protein
MDDLTLVNLKKQARIAAATGDVARARQLYQRILAQTPDDVAVIMDMLPLVNNRHEKQQHLEHVLQIQPYHDEARAALANLTGQSTTAAKPAVEILYCYNHPRRETRLRCNKCGRPICTDCAVRTPVGLRCKACVRQQQDKFYTATPADQFKGLLMAVLGGILLGVAIFFLVKLLGRFGILSFLAAFFLGPPLGGGVAEMVRRSMKRRRARHFALWASIVTIGIATIISLLSGGMFVAGLALFTAAGALYARLNV